MADYQTITKLRNELDDVNEALKGLDQLMYYLDGIDVVKEEAKFHIYGLEDRLKTQRLVIGMEIQDVVLEEIFTEY